MGQCALCRGSFPQSDLLPIAAGSVCAGCKPRYLQLLKEGAPLGTGRVGRSGQLLVMDKTAALPARCVRCNAPAPDRRLVRKLSWHHPLYYLLILPGLLIYAIVAVSVSQKARIEIGLCKAHQAKRQRAILTAWALFAGAIAMFIAAAALENAILVLPAVLLLLGSPIYGVITARTVAAHKIDKERVWLKGVCTEYLDELPSWD